MLRLEYATVNLVRSCAGNTAGMPKSNNNRSMKGRGLLVVGDLKNGIVYRAIYNARLMLSRNFLATAE